MGDLVPLFPGAGPVVEEVEPALISDALASSMLDVQSKIEALFETDDADEFAEIMAALKAQVEGW